MFWLEVQFSQPGKKPSICKEEGNLEIYTSQDFTFSFSPGSFVSLKGHKMLIMARQQSAPVDLTLSCLPSSHIREPGWEEFEHTVTCRGMSPSDMTVRARNGQRQMDTLQDPHICICHASSAGHQSSVRFLHWQRWQLCSHCGEQSDSVTDTPVRGQCELPGRMKNDTAPELLRGINNGTELSWNGIFRNKYFLEHDIKVKYLEELSENLNPINVS